MNNDTLSVSELDLVLEYAQFFLGYGNLDAPCWFVGLEEGSVQKPSEAYNRAKRWRECGGKTILDLQHYAEGLTDDDRRWFRERPPLQPTWKGLIRLVLKLHGQLDVRTPREAKERIRSVQQTEWGRENSKSCLLELFGFPARNGNTWPYEGISRMATRELGTLATFTARKAVFRKTLQEHKPKVVLFYGRQPGNECRTVLWADTCQIPEWNESAPLNRNARSEFLWNQQKNGPLFICTGHAANWSPEFVDNLALFINGNTQN